MPLPGAGVVLREKKEGGGTFAKYKKIKKRLSQSFGKLSELLMMMVTHSSKDSIHVLCSALTGSGSSPDSEIRRASPPTKLDKLRSSQSRWIWHLYNPLDWNVMMLLILN